MLFEFIRHFGIHTTYTTVFFCSRLILYYYTHILRGSVRIVFVGPIFVCSAKLCRDFYYAGRRMIGTAPGSAPHGKSQWQTKKKKGFRLLNFFFHDDVQLFNTGEARTIRVAITTIYKQKEFRFTLDVIYEAV